MAEVIDLSGDGGVLKTVVRKAKEDAIAPSESLPLVDVHYEGTLAETGEVFDTTHEDNSIFSFEIGQGAVIKAWDIALRTMKVGEVAKITGLFGWNPEKFACAWRFPGSGLDHVWSPTKRRCSSLPGQAKMFSLTGNLQAARMSRQSIQGPNQTSPTCKSEYAYGAAGSPPEIPPNATLVFEVELVACRPRKGSSVGSASEEKARLEELKKQRELAAATKEEEKKKREEAKAAAAARVQAKLDAKKGKGKGKGK